MGQLANMPRIESDSDEDPGTPGRDVVLTPLQLAYEQAQREQEAPRHRRLRRNRSESDEEDVAVQEDEEDEETSDTEGMVVHDDEAMELLPVTNQPNFDNNAGLSSSDSENEERELMAVEPPRKDVKKSALPKKAEEADNEGRSPLDRGRSPARPRSRSRSRSRSPPVSRRQQALQVTKQKRKAKVMSSNLTDDDKERECQFIDNMTVRKLLCKLCVCCHTEGPVCKHDKEQQDNHVALLKQWKQEEKEKRLAVNEEKTRQADQKRQDREDKREAKKAQKKLEAKAQRELKKQMKNEKAEADARKVQVFDECFVSEQQAREAKKLLEACGGLWPEQVQEEMKMFKPEDIDGRIVVHYF